MDLIVVLEAVPAAVVLAVGLLVLIRRRAALGRPGTLAIAGTAVLLAGNVAGALLGFYAYRSLLGGSWDLPWWLAAADLVLLPADLLGLPLLAWAGLAGRSARRPAPVTS